MDEIEFDLDHACFRNKMRRLISVILNLHMQSIQTLSALLIALYIMIGCHTQSIFTPVWKT